MKVAALYDVHAMPWALAAVPDDVAAEGVDGTRSIEAHLVRGNGDRKPGEWGLGLVDPGMLAWLEALPMTVSLDGVLYCHSTPADDELLVTEATPDDVLEAAVAALRASGWPQAGEFARENLLAAPTREEAVAHFEQLRAG